MIEKILVIDGLTESFREDGIVRSGLQKSPLMDARAMSTKFDTTFMFCGKDFKDEYNYKKIILSDMGSKDTAISKGLNPKYHSSKLVKDMLLDAKEEIEKYDNIIVHIHSFSSFRIAQLVENKRIMFIVHDIIDKFWYIALCKSFSKAKSTNNIVSLHANSEYSINNAQLIYDRTKEETIKPSELFDGYIKHFVFTEDVPSIESKLDYSSIVGRFAKNKFHHKVFGFNHEHHKIHHYGIKDIRFDLDGSYYKKMIESGNVIRESLPDNEMFKGLSRSASVLILCPHEGFGYTAFEAGIYGALPIVAVNRKAGIGHATSEYLKRAGVMFIEIDYTKKDELFEAILTGRDVSLNDRIEKISKPLLEYFTISNYINERVDILNEGK